MRRMSLIYSLASPLPYPHCLHLEHGAPTKDRRWTYQTYGGLGSSSTFCGVGRQLAGVFCGTAYKLCASKLPRQRDGICENA